MHLDRRSRLFFNDPVPIPNPAELAIRVALETREAVKNLAGILRLRE